MRPRILAVDDDPETTRALCQLLERHGYEVREENDPARAVQAAREFLPQFVILDYSMPKFHGGDVAWEFANETPLAEVKVIFCSGLSEEEVRSKLPPTRIPVLGKPVDTTKLLALLDQSKGLAAHEFRRPASRPA
jgi:CheY-like chemotaxis protein